MSLNCKISLYSLEFLNNGQIDLWSRIMHPGLYLIRKKKKTCLALNIADCLQRRRNLGEEVEQKVKVTRGVGRFMVTSGRVEREIELRFILHMYFINIEMELYMTSHLFCFYGFTEYIIC